MLILKVNWGAINELCTNSSCTMVVTNSNGIGGWLFRFFFYPWAFLTWLYNGSLNMLQSAGTCHLIIIHTALCFFISFDGFAMEYNVFALHIWLRLRPFKGTFFNGEAQNHSPWIISYASSLLVPSFRSQSLNAWPKHLQE